MAASEHGPVRWLRRDGADWEKVAFAEVLIPNVSNLMGDYWTEDAIVEAAHMFMIKGFKRDIEHDQLDHSSEWSVVESFIAGPDNPTFVPGSWVVGIKVHSDAVWQDILDCNINGFSYEALVSFLAAQLEEDASFSFDKQGITEPCQNDGHVHSFAIVVDINGRPVSGVTDVVQGHIHAISCATFTELTDGHRHRINLIQKGVK